ncbi:MAG TPA: hypothetical protein IAD42_10750 [Candidatus Scatomorpha pullistercoris]|uniref:Uncharacterized protein n=1 Tax=Candidatus Scatomorpha pullistercoris TaxID=2840929 RepID=A0A9D1G862_9FIRM|nr:hypothetical protein [Candidatus Scatomorpha pullistercoris]
MSCFVFRVNYGASFEFVRASLLEGKLRQTLAPSSGRIRRRSKHSPGLRTSAARGASIF